MRTKLIISTLLFLLIIGLTNGTMILNATFDGGSNSGFSRWNTWDVDYTTADFSGNTFSSSGLKSSEYYQDLNLSQYSGIGLNVSFKYTMGTFNQQYVQISFDNATNKGDGYSSHPLSISFCERNGAPPCWIQIVNATGQMCILNSNTINSGDVFNVQILPNSSITVYQNGVYKLSCRADVMQYENLVILSRTTNDDMDDIVVTSLTDPTSAPTLTNGSVKPSAVEVGAEVLFNVTGKQAENSDTTLYVCSNNVTSTSTCNRLCVSSAVAFNSATDTAITCTYTTNDTGYSNTAYAFLNSVGGSSPNLPLTYDVNHPPYTTSAITYLDTTGDNVFYYRESMDYFRLSVNDSDNPTITVNFTITDPDAVVKVNNVQGTQNGIVWGYEPNLMLDALGTWTVSVVSTDVLGTSITNTTTFYVNSTQKSTSNNYYGVYYPNLPATTSIDNDLLYGYGVYEFNITV